MKYSFEKYFASFCQNVQSNQLSLSQQDDCQNGKDTFKHYIKPPSPKYTHTKEAMYNKEIAAAIELRS